MRSASVGAALLLGLICPAAVRAGEPGGLGIVPFTIDLDANLEGGSELAAGVDPNAGQQIVHPGNVSDPQAGLRALGSVFQQGSGSAAVQFNPFLTLWARDKVYHEVVRAREAAGGLGRFATDLAATLVLAAGSPYPGPDATRFSTLGLGLAWDLIGERSIYSSAFDECLNGPEAAAARWQDIRMLLPGSLMVKPWTESQREYDAKIEKYFRERPNATTPEDYLQREVGRIEACQEQRKRSDALFFSLGGNWVAPGSNRNGDDALIRVHREFLATSYELNRWAGLRFALQARMISQRPSESDVLRTSLDFGIAAQFARPNFSLTLEADRSAVAFNGGPPTAAVSATLKIALPHELSAAFGVQGRSTTFGSALQHIVGVVTLSYRDKPVLTQGLGFYGR
jgi:hypothetical protein